MSLLTLALLITLHPLEQKGIGELYNLEFQSAIRTFEILSHAEPASPAGPHHLATALWMEELTRRGAMAGETFQSSRYWTRTHKEPPPPALIKRFQDEAEEAKRRAEELLESPGGNLEALYFLGATESVVSAFQATILHSYFSSYRAGRRAKKHHEELTKLDPAYADAYLIPGTYHYTIATLPRSVKLLIFLFGIRGSKEKGVQLIRRAARDGKRTFWGAQLLLTVIDTREKRYDQALTYLEKLETAFPKNPLFPLERGWVLLLKKDWASARAVFHGVQAKRRQIVPHYDQVSVSLLHLRLGESLLFDGRFQNALEQFDAALASGDSPDVIRAMTHLRRGQTLDGLLRREEARDEYQLTLRINADKTSYREAKRYLKQPFELR